MPGHTSWRTLRKELMAQPGATEAYERTRRAKEVGERVRAAREQAGISQSELARRMSTNQASVARLEAGIGDPKLSTIARASIALNAELVIEIRDRDGDAPD